MKFPLHKLLLLLTLFNNNLFSQSHYAPFPEQEGTWIVSYSNSTKPLLM
jgi:hypothetical protein